MINVQEIDFDKLNGLLPAVILDINTGQVIMLGFMNAEALEITLEKKQVTFFSRSKNRLWTKGETSGNYLLVEDIIKDCDNDSILVYANPQGPTCHTGDYSCFGIKKNNLAFLSTLSDVVRQRKQDLPEGSYTSRLFKEGADRIIQKVGEEAIEVVIAAKNKKKDEIIYESSDLIYHLIVLFAENNIQLNEVIAELERRHRK